MSDVLEQTRSGLEKFLTQEWQTEVRVDKLALASAGARRRNVLFEARRGHETLDLVATIIPAAGMQIVPIEAEAASLRLAEAAGTPAPHVHAVTSDAAYVGGPFFITSRVDGETIPRRILRLVEATPGLGAKLARDCGRALARLHAAPLDGMHPLLREAAGRPPIERTLVALEEQMRGLLQPSPAFALTFRWLERHRPPEPLRQTVVHADFRNGNIIVGENGLRAALDWEACHPGDPMEDLGWLCQRMWRFRNDTLEVGGFASRDELRAGYVEAGGSWDESRFHWWKTQSTLRWGIGLAGQAAAHLDGSFSSIVMAASGRRVAELEYDALMLLRVSYA